MCMPVGNPDPQFFESRSAKKGRFKGKTLNTLAVVDDSVPSTVIVQFGVPSVPFLSASRAVDAQLASLTEMFYEGKATSRVQDLRQD